MSKTRGFAVISEERRREIASRAGRLAHERGTAHEWTPDEARKAGQKGGGILLRSGEDPKTLRVDAIARAFDAAATSLDEIDARYALNARAIDTIRRAIARAREAIDRLEQRTRA